MLNQNVYKDATRRIARGDGSPVAGYRPLQSFGSGCFDTILILNDYKDAERRRAEGDGSPVASPPKAEVESGATMTAKLSARLRRGEILLPHTKEMI